MPLSTLVRARRGPRSALLVSALLVGGCPGSSSDDGDPDLSTASTRNRLIWKRQHALTQDLVRALELEPTELCTELGELDCINDVHQASLGGHDPIAQGLYEPIAEPLTTTPLALDRVALAACGRRVQLDRQAPVVFTTLALDGEAPSADAPAFEQTVVTLYRRLLGREPTPEELELHAELLVDDAGERVGADRFAHLSCFVVVTSAEFLFI
ncbi:MAG: hypothetical protein AAGF11_05450 [Myxococcota bacterium]